jgi:hypothetical protein
MNNNVDLPQHIYAKLRTEFCNNLSPGTEGLIDCVIFAAETVHNRALGFHVLRDDGALIAHVPVHALCWKPCPVQPLENLEPWDCFGYWITAIRFEHLAECEMDFRCGQEIMRGKYICTFDFIANGYSDEPEQHKHFHFIRGDDGNFALQPNNFVQVLHKSFTDKLFDWQNPPAIQTNRLHWYCESQSRDV